MLLQNEYFLTIKNVQNENRTQVPAEQQRTHFDMYSMVPNKFIAALEKGTVLPEQTSMQKQTKGLQTKILS